MKWVSICARRTFSLPLCQSSIMNEKIINGKSIMNIMASCIKCGSEITVECDGPDEQAMLNEAISLIESGFGE